jgi:hypothetical protein
MAHTDKNLKYNKLYVTTGTDTIIGSLRHAVIKANLSSHIPSHVIIKSSVGEHITLIDGEIVIASNIKLTNESNNKVKIKSTNSRIFHVTSPSNYLKIGSHKTNPIIFYNSFYDDNGGAIYIEVSNHHLILKHVTIEKCQAQSGGGIYTNGNVILLFSKISFNKANIQGGGIWAGQSVTLYQSLVTQNEVLISSDHHGGGGIFIDNGDCVLNSSSITENSVAYDLNARTGGAGGTGGSGGGIVIMAGSLYVQNKSHVDYNKAYNSGGIQEGVGNVYITDKSTINYNQSFNQALGAAGGGGVTIILGTVFLSQSQICHNKTVGMYSGGIISLVGNIEITNHSQIIGNSNCGPGGGLAMNLGSVSISQSEISDNTGASLGGGFVNFTPYPGLISISESVISNNKLTNAETMRQTIEAFLSVITGNLTSMSNQATQSGGSGGQTLKQNILTIISQLTTAQNTLNSLSLNILGNNTIAGGGIATLLSTNLIVLNSQIENNSMKQVSDQNYPFNGYGGGIFSFGANVNIQNCLIKKNKALTDGGGIYNGTNSSVMIVDTTINENSTRQNGGGILNLGTLEIISSLITHNKAGTNGGGVYTNSKFVKLLTKIKSNKPSNITG